MSGFPLTGIDPGDPIPGIIREIRFAQGESSNATKPRNVVLVGNKTATGTEAVETLGEPVSGDSDMIARFGNKSELYLMYRNYVSVDQSATIYAVAVTEGAGIAEADFTFSTLGVGATGPAAVKVSCIGETVQVPVANGDTPAAVAAATIIKINEQAHWPITATAGLAPEDVKVQAANSGTRHDYEIEMTRMSMTADVDIAVAKAAVVPAATDDDFGNAIGVLAGAEIYYHVAAKTGTTAPASATDGGIGEYIAMINAQALPANGKGQLVHFALVGTAAQAAAVATSGFANAARGVFWHAQNNDWTPAMIAAQCTAARRSKEVGHPGANLTDFGKGANDTFLIPKPFASTDNLTESDVRSDLNNGVTPLRWTQQGQGYIVRQITSRSLNGAVQDYRVREGHIPSVMDDYWEQLFIRYFTTKQPFVADNPPEGEPPLQGVTYPRDLVALNNRLVDDLIAFTGGPTLDPSFKEAMKQSFVAVRLTDGISCKSRPIAVKHNNKGQFLIEEASAAY